MTIALVTGPPGSGKTYYAVRKIVKALKEGRPVVTNVGLVPDWQQRMRKLDPLVNVVPRERKRWKKAHELYFYSDDLRELMQIRVKGKDEDRGLIVLDESHNWMNSRSWSTSDRGEIIRWFTQHRKHGWEVILISQQAGMLDRQVRELFEYHIKLRNLKKARMYGVPICPVNMFLAVWLWHSGQRIVIKREIFPLTRVRGLYATMALTHGEEDSGDYLWMPATTQEVQDWRSRREQDAPHQLGTGAVEDDGFTVVDLDDLGRLLSDPTGSEIEDDVEGIPPRDPTGDELDGDEWDPESLDPSHSDTDTSALVPEPPVRTRKTRRARRKASAAKRKES